MSEPVDDLDFVGRQLFGRSLRLRVLHWIVAESYDRRFFQLQAAEGVGYGASGVSEELRRLVDLGMLRRADPDGSRRVYFSVTDSPLWAGIVEICSAVERADRVPSAPPEPLDG